MNNVELSAPTVAYYQKGSELSDNLHAYIGALDQEFKNETSPRLQKMAYTGLKIVTGKDIAACYRLAQQWRDYMVQIIKTKDQEAVEVFLDTVATAKWLNFFDQFLSFIMQAPLEAEKFLKSEAERAEVEELFTRIGVTLIRNIIEWFEANDTLKSLLPQFNECNPVAELASGGMEATIGLVALDQKKNSAASRG